MNKQLPNGANIVRIYEDVLSETGVVMAVNGRDYVTWVFYRGDRASTSHGHYFPKAHYSDAFDRAWADFNKRVAEI